MPLVAKWYHKKQEELVLSGIRIFFVPRSWVKNIYLQISHFITELNIYHLNLCLISQMTLWTLRDLPILAVGRTHAIYGM